MIVSRMSVSKAVFSPFKGSDTFREITIKRTKPVRLLCVVHFCLSHCLPRGYADSVAKAAATLFGNTDHQLRKNNIPETTEQLR